MSLKQYQKKRDFKVTPEPSGKSGHAQPKAKTASSQRFVIQKHDASRLHYDFRLELDGVLKSWAVPKGLPTRAGDKRLAVETEDHPIAYIDFEGTIPKGQYGGGTVMVWDQGQYTPLDDAAKGLNKGKLHFELDGQKLHGEWYLLRMSEERQWLIIKSKPGMKAISKKMDDTSAITGRSMSQIADAEDALWQSNRKEKKKKTRSSTPDASISSAKGDVLHRASSSREMPEFIQPMKAKLVAELPRDNWLYEVKFDGYRALAFVRNNRAKLLSRNRIDLGGKYPQVVDAVESLAVDDAILDGEVVALDKEGQASFHALQAFGMSSDDKKKPELAYCVFDLLWLQGHDLRHLTLQDRRSLLEELLSDPPGVIRLSEILEQSPAAIIKEARKLNLEGLIAKRPESTYETGKRSGAWVKYKLQNEQEFVIGGFTQPSGSRRFFGSLMVGVYEGDQLLFTGKVGSGFSHKTLADMHEKMMKLATEECPFDNLRDHPRHGQLNVTRKELQTIQWVKPKLVAQVKFANWTPDQLLRQPVFLGLRLDKSPRQVICERAVKK